MRTASNSTSLPTGSATRGSLVLLSATMALLTSCASGPKYPPPALATTPTFRELDSTTWKTAAPGEAIQRGRWWEIFHDTTLNALEEQVDSGNQTVAAAAAHYDASLALVRQARSQYFPSVDTTPSYNHVRLAVTPYSQTSSGITYGEYSIPVTATWAPDFWGRVRKNVAASVYSAQNSAADLENAKLLAHASLATCYFQMSGIEAQKQLLDATTASWRKYLDLTRSLAKNGLGNDEAVAAAESQLDAARSQETNLGIARSQYEHAIAVLIGRSPSSLSLPGTGMDSATPEIPGGLPSQLLERRPDIAMAERSMAAANAQIGVAKGAYFPDIVLSASGGLESLTFLNWFSWPSRFWSIGLGATETIFDAGLRRARVAQYKAQYEEAIASYRQTALVAFQQVEDDLATLRILKVDLEQQQQAVEAARRALRQATTRNTAGLDPFLNVLTAQINLLTYQQAALTFQTQQRVASVALISALGGGWDTGQLPTPKQIARGRKP